MYSLSSAYWNFPPATIVLWNSWIMFTLDCTSSNILQYYSNYFACSFISANINCWKSLYSEMSIWESDKGYRYLMILDSFKVIREEIHASRMVSTIFN